MRRFFTIHTLSLAFPLVLTAAPKVLPVLNATLPDQVLDINATAQSIDVPSLFGTEEIDDQVVRFTSQASNGAAVMDFALFSNRTPITRTNFLQYVTDGDYDHSFIHRSVPGFVIQGGGFRNTNPNDALSVGSVPTDPAITNEFGVSNTLGTISMAKNGGDPNSATSQWFVSLGDNSANLDNQNGGFTVFGRVTKGTMATANNFGDPVQFPIWNAGGAFSNLPLIASFDGSASIQHTDLILFPTVTLAPLPAGEAGESTTLTYTVDNTDPSVVTTTLSATNQLQLSYPSDSSGVSTITVSATDSVGNVVADHFTIKVLQPYSLWKETNFNEADAADPSVSGPDEDPNHDGISNLRLYIHGLTIDQNHTDPVTMTTTSGFAVFSYPIVNNLKGITTQMQRSTDLGITDPWTSVPYTVISRTTDNLLDTVSIRANSALTGDRAFYRLVFTLAE
ncbi:hypothetical protein NT6N_17250 [Oceaniferula spumae]|uniref:peptidylprolyl isomerase n=1 Tax=Oceaniferula spumae TaxID=2979115 RepID=A0AAT9FL01_9BACT